TSTIYFKFWYVTVVMSVNPSINICRLNEIIKISSESFIDNAIQIFLRIILKCRNMVGNYDFPFLIAFFNRSFYKVQILIKKLIASIYRKRQIIVSNQPIIIQSSANRERLFKRYSCPQSRKNDSGIIYIKVIIINKKYIINYFFNE